MNAMTGFNPADTTGAETPGMTHTLWGYIIRSDAPVKSDADMAQWMSGLLGVSLFLAAIGFWLVPGAFFGPDVAVLKYVVTGVLTALGIVCLWYATQGTAFELHVDLSRNELREAVRNKKGQTRLLSRFAFDELGSVYIDRSGRNAGNRALMVRFERTAKVLEVARGSEEQMLALRDRLGRDLLSGTATMRHMRKVAKADILRQARQKKLLALSQG